MVSSEQTSGRFESRDGTTLFFRAFPAGQERARLVIAHGLGEHSGRYGHLAEHLVPGGLSIWAMDHRGHGQSGGRRGHIRTFDEYLNDLYDFVVLCKKNASREKKCFLLGHSLGGLMVLLFAGLYPKAVDGLIVSSPALGLNMAISRIKRWFGSLMSNLRPTLLLSNELDPAWLSHDKGVVQAYREDPLVHGRISVRWFAEFLSAMEKAAMMAPHLEVPVLMQVAGNDHLVDATVARGFFESLSIRDKTLHIYDGLYHEIYNELETDRKTGHPGSHHMDREPASIRIPRPSGAF